MNQITTTADEQSAQDEIFMREALSLARRAADLGEVPVGALVVYGDNIISRAWNQPITGCDPTAHAEMVALRAAAKAMGNYRLVDCQLFVTLEPCTMCAGALVHSRLRRVIFGAYEPKAGAVSSQMSVFDAAFMNHKVEYTGGVLAAECGQLISDFFQARREKKRALRRSAEKDDNTPID